MTGRMPNERTFIVGSNEVIMKTSADILAGFSPLFDAMFFGDLADKRETIPLPDDDAEVFAALVEYVHSAEARLPSVEFAIRTYDLASKYFVTTLQHACSEFLFENYDKFLGLSIYECFKENSAPEDVTKRALELCQFYAEEIFETESHLNVQISTLIDLFKCEHLNIASEFTLILALAKYKEANESCTTEQISMAFKHIRVLSIAPKILLRKDHAVIVSKFANLKDYISCKIQNLPENSSSLTGIFNPSMECRSRSWRRGMLKVYLRSKACEKKEHVIKKFTTSALSVNPNYPVTLRGVVLGLAQQYVIPEMDVVVTVQNGYDNVLAGERFHLKNVDSIGVKCFFKESVFLSERDGYDLSVVFMNDICTHSVFTAQDIFLKNKYHYVSSSPIIHSNEAINSILKGLIITFCNDPNDDIKIII